MQRLKNTQVHSQSLYEKEVRRARKEAFKSSSALVKLQEELKNTRNKFTLVKEDYEIQRKKVENRAQEAFTAKYELVGVQEELEEARRRIQIMEEEKDALKTSLKEEEVARIAAEGKISLPVPAEPDEFSSPRKARRESGKENVDPEVFEDFEDISVLSDEDELEELKEELSRERRMRLEALDLIKFMNIECQFGRCSCQIAKQQGRTYIYDKRYDMKTGTMKWPVVKQPVPDSEESATPATPPQKSQRTEEESQPPRSEEEPEPQDTDPANAEPLIEFSPTTGTFRTIPSPVRQPLPTRPTPSRAISQDITALASQLNPFTALAPPLNPVALSESPSLLSLGDTETATAPSTKSPTASPIITTTNLTDLPAQHIAIHPLPRTFSPSPPPQRETTPTPTPETPPPPRFNVHLPQRPQTISRIVTTTTTIPLADPFSPAPKDPSEARPVKDMRDMKNMPYSPASTMTREQALEQIRQRRGRARSIAAASATPRKLVIDARRDVSAPVPGKGGL